MTEEHTAHITSKHRIGWGYSKQAVRGKIEPPSSPDHTGTIGQVLAKIKRDRQYKADQNLQKIEAWFYRGAMITGIDTGDYASTLPREIDIFIRAVGSKPAKIWLDRKPRKR